MLRLWKGFSGTSLPARQPQPLITLIAWSVPVINGGLCTQKTVWASDTKAGLALLYFWQNGFENCATGTDVANISFYAEGSLFFFFFSRSMAYYAFFIEGIEVAWTEKSWCKTRKKQTKQNKKKTSKMFTKKLKQMSSACSISQSLLSSVVNMFQMTFSWKKKISLQHCRMWGVTPSQE